MNSGKVILLTGMSGSGKSTAARALEDAGFFVIDNLPLALLPQTLEMAGNDPRSLGQLAVVVDVRNRAFLADYKNILETVRQAGHHLEIYFFTAADDSLLRRYSETRRRHPLSESHSITEGIARERYLLEGLRKESTQLFDSTGLTPQQLRERILAQVLGETGQWPLNVHVESFGYRYGLPLNADLVFDVRFMPNPFYLKHLRDLTGLDAPVQDYVLGQEVCRRFLELLGRLLDYLLPLYREEGKNYLTLAFGCTGGKHRSVTLVEHMRSLLPREGLEVTVSHRDIAKR